jgi:Spy/CpxP family protein refolding chaperone
MRCLIACAVLAPAMLPAMAQGPYAGQESRELKALSADEIEGYLAGRGMGFAKAAELNGYAGPAHVLELSAKLDLTPAQTARTQALFAAMSAKAVVLGRALVEAERRLDRLFASKTVTSESLSAALAEIGTLQARLRGVHLEAHLAQVEILSPEQSLRYAALRGYSASHGHSGRDTAHKH